MNYVAVLAGNRDLGGITPSQAEAARRAASAGDIHWLAHGVAAEFHLEADGHALPEALIRASLGDAPIDVAVLPAGHRRKKLLVADMDSTIIGCECIDELADFAGVKAEVAEITERAMRGELDFPEALRHRVSLLKDLDIGALQMAYDERVRLNPGARALVKTMNTHGAFTALISGGFTFFTSRVAEITGFHLNRANILGSDGAFLDGTVAEPILGREAKLAGLIELRDARGLLPQETLAVGDGANDLAMIEAAGLGVAYRAKPLVAAAARAKLDHADLTALLYFQGYADHEIVAN